MRKLELPFYLQNAYEGAKAICGKILCVRQADGSVMRRRITETECYMGEEDTACHAHKGRTARTDVMYRQGGAAYVYLCYGMHNMLNIVTGEENLPQAVLIRGVEGASGPGKLTKLFGIDRSFNGISFLESDRIWLETDSFKPTLKETPRIGIQYAREEDQGRLWRFIVTNAPKSIIAACGNNCAACPRYNTPQFRKTEEELNRTAELWMKIGYRDRVVPAAEITCSGCKPENWCRYHVAGCCAERGIGTCAECPDYPCPKMKECFEVTASFEPKCREVCSEEEYKILEEAFFRKEENLLELKNREKNNAEI